jgi:hypothetical protein
VPAASGAEHSGTRHEKSVTVTKCLGPLYCWARSASLQQQVRSGQGRQYLEMPHRS